MDTPTASIILTTFNRKKLLKRAFESAINQTYGNYEIIVVDDAGTTFPGIRKAIMSYAHGRKVKYIRHKNNKGLSAARNTGIKAAKGKYIVCLDDDNELMPEFLEYTIRHITEDAIGVGRIIKYKKFDDYAWPHLSPFTAIDWGWLIKREVFYLTPYIQYDEKLRANEDTDFGIQFFKAHKATTINIPLAIAYDTENSLSFPDEREIKGMYDFMNKNRKEYEGHPNETRVLLRTMGRKCYRGGYKIAGLRYFRDSFLAKPGLNSFLNLFFILFGWYTYDKFMTVTEYVGSKVRR